MIDLQDHLRNRGLLNLFAKQEQTEHQWDYCTFVCDRCAATMMEVSAGLKPEMCSHE